MIKVGGKYIFDSHGNDSTWSVRDGEIIKVIRPLTEKEADIFDVGPMFRCVFKDGVEVDAFLDELVEEVK